MPRLQPATGPMDRKPMPRTPKRRWKWKPSRLSGISSTRPWNATPSVQVPAVSARVAGVQNPIGCCAALPNIAMNTPKPRQLITFAPTELHA